MITFDSNRKASELMADLDYLGARLVSWDGHTLTVTAEDTQRIRDHLDALGTPPCPVIVDEPAWSYEDDEGPAGRCSLPREGQCTATAS